MISNRKVVFQSLERERAFRKTLNLNSSQKLKHTFYDLYITHVVGKSSRKKYISETSSGLLLNDKSGRVMVFHSALLLSGYFGGGGAHINHPRVRCSLFKSSDKENGLALTTLNKYCRINDNLPKTSIERHTNVYSKNNEYESRETLKNNVYRKITKRIRN